MLQGIDVWFICGFLCIEIGHRIRSSPLSLSEFCCLEEFIKGSISGNQGCYGVLVLSGFRLILDSFIAILS